MSLLDRLLAESIPTRPAPAEPWRQWTTAEQDAHWNALCDAIGQPNEKRPHHPAA